jgi:hypothetical protein
MTKRIFLFFLACLAVPSAVAYAVHAEGEWNFGAVEPAQNGTISFDFPANGGEVDGRFLGEGYATDLKLDGFFDGNFTGGWDGAFKGTFTGGADYTWVDPRTGTKTPANVSFDGDWTGSLTKDGKMNIVLMSSNAPSTNLTASFDVGDFELELSMSEYEQGGGLMESGIEAPSIGQFGNFSGAYIIVDGKKVDLEAPEDALKKIKFHRGTVIGTYDKNSWCDIKLEDGSEINLSGEGSEISIITMADIDKDLWKKTVGGGVPSGTVITAAPGQFILKYKTGNKEGYLFPQNKEDKEGGVVYAPGGYEQKVEGSDEPLDLMYVVFSNPVEEDFSELADAIGNVGGLRDFGHKAPPLEVVMPEIDDGEEESSGGLFGFLFANHSEVEYDYDGETVKLKVIEGNVEVLSTDFDGNVSKIADVKTGENYEVNVADYNGSEVDEIKSAGIISYFIGGGILFVFFAILTFFGIRRMKAGKLKSHWTDY